MIMTVDTNEDKFIHLYISTEASRMPIFWCNVKRTADHGKDGCKPVSVDPERSSLGLKAQQGPASEE